MRQTMVVLGIIRRSCGDAPFLRALRREPLNQLQMDVILGSLLGDASLTLHTVQEPWRQTYRITFAHGEHQLEYLKHKREALGGGSRISPRHRPENLWSNDPHGHWGGQIYQFVFQHKFGLASLVRDIHWNTWRKTVTPDWADLLTQRAVAYWYQDDGSFTPGSSTLIFSTNSFNPDEVTLLQGALWRTCKLETQLNWKHDKGKIYVTLHAGHLDQIRRFFDLIDPFVVNCLKYKLSALDRYANRTMPRSNRPAAA